MKNRMGITDAMWNSFYGRMSIILVLLVVAGYFGGGFLSAGGIEGSTPISVQQIDVQSTNPILSGKVMHIVSLADGTSRYMTGTLSREGASLFGVFTSRDFTLTDEIKNYVCQVQVMNESSFDIHSYRAVCTSSSPRTFCASHPNCRCGASCGSGKSVCAYSTGYLGTLKTLGTQTRTLYEVEHKITVGENSTSVILSTSSLVGQNDLMYARLMGNLQGWTSCPVPAASYRVFIPTGTSNFQLKDEIYAQAVITNCMAPSDGATTTACNAAISAMASSTVTRAFSGCSNATFNGTQTTLSCTPTELPAIPQIETFIKADFIGLVVPVGEPEIISINAPPCDAASACSATVIARNKGTFADSFDFAIQGLTPTSTREQFAAGEEKTISIPYQQNGVIRKFNFTMTSVNDPTKKAVVEQTIKVYPFCTQVPNSPNKIKVWTEYGCQYACPPDSLYRHNIYEENCNRIPDYPLFYSETANERTNAEGVNETIRAIVDATGAGWNRHCTGVGTYTTLWNYLYGENEFIPEQREHQVWMGAPYCKYVAEYGFAVVGGQVQQITDGLTYYDRSPQLGEEIIIVGITTTPVSETPTPDTSTIEAPTEEPPVSTTPIETEPVQEEINWVYVGGAIIGLAAVSFGIWYFFFRKKR